MSSGDGSDCAVAGDEVVPGVATGIENIFVGIEDAVREVGLAEILPDVLDRIEFGTDGRQRRG